jgi:hypothetical protein
MLGHINTKKSGFNPFNFKIETLDGVLMNNFKCQRDLFVIWISKILG